MKNINLILCAIFIALFWTSTFAKPMEALSRYNVVLVHGAADSLSGMYCEASDLEEAYSYYDTTVKSVEDIFGRTKSYYDIS